jgi:EF hand
MWRESKLPASGGGGAALGPPSSSALSSSSSGGKVSFDPSVMSFEAGQIFSKFDKDGDGLLNKTEFEQLMSQYPELFRGGNGVSNRPTFPTEVISGRVLTHYDETAGIAIPSAAIDQHRAIGNTVLPLIESYRSRYDRLRSQLTSKLLPRREHLLQLRRQLQNTSVEVSAVRKGIERETLTDAEQILERLRGVESMRQSAVKHEVRFCCFSLLGLSAFTS